ncbi:hypothetical protein V8E51_008920 [Hyaloscypha variabilis]
MKLINFLLAAVLAAAAHATPAVPINFFNCPIGPISPVGACCKYYSPVTGEGKSCTNAMEINSIVDPRTTHWVCQSDNVNDVFVQLCCDETDGKFENCSRGTRGLATSS